MKTFKFFFDFLSPFSYLAWQELKKSELKFTMHPVALGPLLNHWEIKGPGEITPKREFLLKQCFRMATEKGIPFTTPKTHPFNSLYALRLALGCSAQDEQFKVVDLLWSAGWDQGIDMGEPDELIRILNEGGLNGQEIYERSFSKEARAELKKNIQEAIGSGVFGVPSFLVDDELFWGQDSLKYLEQFLKGEDLLDREKYEKAIANTPRAAVQSLPST